MAKKPLTKEFLIERGSCCGGKCQNCPYAPKYVKGNKVLENNKNNAEKQKKGKTI